MPQELQCYTCGAVNAQMPELREPGPGTQQMRKCLFLLAVPQLQHPAGAKLPCPPVCPGGTLLALSTQRAAPVQASAYESKLCASDRCRSSAASRD